MVIREYHEYSPVMTLLVKLFSNIFDKSKLAVNICIILDKLVINTIGKFWSLFGPGAVFFIFQKKIYKI